MTKQSISKFLEKATKTPEEIVEEFKLLECKYELSYKDYPNRVHIRIIGTDGTNSDGHFMIENDELYMSKDITRGTSKWRNNFVKESLQMIFCDELNEGTEINLNGRKARKIESVHVMCKIVDCLEKNHRDFVKTSLKNAEYKTSLIYNSNEKNIKNRYNASVYKRKEAVAIAVKELANGKCQLCGLEAPFIDRYGDPFLEAHHIVFLKNGGSDTIDNVVALCPNCHRKMHHAPTDARMNEDIKKLKKQAQLNIEKMI